jgi:hypothetical protein
MHTKFFAENPKGRDLSEYKHEWENIRMDIREIDWHHNNAPSNAIFYISLSLTLWRRILPEKLKISQLVKTFTTFYGN